MSGLCEHGIWNHECGVTKYPHYFSTYCIHRRCDECRLTCKTCQAPCQCPCHHTTHSDGQVTPNEEGGSVGG